MEARSLDATDVRVWTDPSCPWAWQTASWLLDLRDRGLVALTWSLFSLEVNASPPDRPFPDAAPRFGHLLACLALARRDGGDTAFESLYLALGRLLHVEKQEPTNELLRGAAIDAGQPDLPNRAAAMPDLADEVLEEYRAARELDVFGVPTLRIGSDKVLYGPLFALAPIGDDALTLWEDIRRISARPDFFELKRWPRDVPPGEVATPRSESPR